MKIVLFLSLFSFLVYGASFDCKKATTSVEKTICKDTKLSQLDEELAKVYKKVLHLSMQNTISRYNGSSIYHFFKNKQKKWLRQRNRSCSSYKGKEQSVCLKSYYTSRIKKLQEFSENGSFIYQGFGSVIYDYTHRPSLARNFRPYLDKASFKKLSNELLRWEDGYSVCANKYGVRDENCTREVAKKQRKYYDDLLESYKNTRYLLEDGKCLALQRESSSFIERNEDESICMEYHIYHTQEIQKLFSKPVDFTEVEFQLPKDANSCSSDTSRLYAVTQQTIEYITKNIVVVKDESYDYTGGAHGDYASSYLNLDRNSAKVISWSDLFGKKEDKLFAFIVKNVRDRIGFEYIDALSDKELYDMTASTHRMQLTPQGVIISFGLYEISAYADGEPSFLIPLKRLKRVMSDEKFHYYFAQPIKMSSICKKRKGK